MKQKKGQIVLIGMILIIFLVGGVFALFFNYFSGGNEESRGYENLHEDAVFASDNLLSQGFPRSWDAQSVQKLGLLEGDKVLMSNLAEFSKFNYSKSKLMIGIQQDYMFYFEHANGTILPIEVDGGSIEFLGWSGIPGQNGNGGGPFPVFFNLIDGKTSNLAREERFINFEEGYTPNNKAKLTLYTWDSLIDDLDSYSCECDPVNISEYITDYCGDTLVQPELSEQCDDGNDANGDGCSSSCLNEYCGDDVLQPGTEECDEGNKNGATDSVCQSDCTLQDLAGYWSFNESFNDLSGYANHGIAGNGSVNITNGSLALQGGEGDYIEIPDSDSLDITDEITLSSCVKLDSFTNKCYMKIIMKSIPDPTTWPWELYTLDFPCTSTKKRPRFIISDGDTVDITHEVVQAPEDLKEDTWYHLAGTYDGSLMKLFINGTLVNTHSTSITIGTNDEPLRIGRTTAYHDTSLGGINGRIDEVRVYNRALLDAEVANLDVCQSLN